MALDSATSPVILSVDRVSLTAPRGLSLLLEDISLTLQEGDRVAIIGPSGAGKTSLLRLLNRLSDPHSGHLSFGQTPYDRIPVLQLRRHIVLTPQEPKLLGMTVQEALAYPLKLQNRPKAEIRDRVATICDRFRIPHEWLERSELQLSLGQRQLCAIARALILDPKILLLDEPTSALDVGTAAHVVDVLKAQTNLTIVMVNHHLDLAATLCDRILYLDQGRLCHDVPANAARWQQFREQLLATEAAIARDWDEE
jgi:D-methionine transport system ATP-binding protein